MRTMLAHSCILAALFLAIFGAAQSVLESPDSFGKGTLSPICSGGAYKKRFVANEDAKIAETDNTRGLTMTFLDCFGYLRQAVFEPTTSADNTTENQELCRRAAEATQINLHVNSISTQTTIAKVPFDAIYGDSIHGTAYVENERTYLEWHVSTPATLPAGCTGIDVSWTYPARISGSRSSNLVQESAPRLLGVRPFIVLKNVPQTFRFARPKKSGLVNGSSGDMFYVVSTLKSCLAGPESALDSSAIPTYGTPDPNSPNDRDIDAANEVVAEWDYTFVSSGLYRVCVQPYDWTAPTSSNGFTWKGLEIGYLAVFGGNPAFFTFLGTDQDDRVDAATTYTLVIEGFALDLRPGRDEAKFILINRHRDGCGSNPQGGASIVSTDLGPSDDYGHNVTLAHLNVTFSQRGTWWLCYKRHGGEWTRVYPFFALSGGAQEAIGNVTNHLQGDFSDVTFAPEASDIVITQAPGTPPTPTTEGNSQTTNLQTFTPVPGTATTTCTRAEEFDADKVARENPAGLYVTLGLSSAEDRNQQLAQTLANIICVPLEVIYLSQAAKVNGQWEVRVQLACVKQCNNDDALNYLNWLFSDPAETSPQAVTSLRNLFNTGIRTATPESISQALTVGEQESTSTSSNSLLIIVVVVLIIVIVTVAIVALVVYMKKNRTASPRNNNSSVQFHNSRGQPVDYDHAEAGGPTPTRGVVVGEPAEQDRAEAETAQPGAAWDVDMDPAAKPSR